jgi:hypothetical protein
MVSGDLTNNVTFGSMIVLNIKGVVCPFECKNRPRGRIFYLIKTKNRGIICVLVGSVKMKKRLVEIQQDYERILHSKESVDVKDLV